jgi:F0F1-type ATP synthase membrane subunit b/b'
MARQGTDDGQERPDGEDRHEKARQLAEEALGELAKGREDRADRLIEEAKKLDESALTEVVEELEEDAGSDPNAADKLPD